MILPKAVSLKQIVLKFFGIKFFHYFNFSVSVVLFVNL